MKFQCNDGGRSEAGYKNSKNDCVVRAISIALNLPYKQVHEELFALNKVRNQDGWKCSPRERGTKRKTVHEYLKSKGWNWTATMGVGTGCKVHLNENELPSGRIICKVSRHLVTAIDGIINDVYDCSRDGSRCVYGYWQKVI